MELEDIIEPAKSGRARCKTTGDKIPKGELRFGEAFVNTFSSSGSIGYRWHKLEAAAKRFPKKVKKALEAYEGEVPEREKLEGILAEALEKEASKPGGYPYADHAPTGRATCIVTGEKIPKGSVRVAVEREIDTGSFVRKGPGYMRASAVGRWCEEEGLDEEAFVKQLVANTRVVEEKELRAALEG
ncbi:MAG TPA: hypothetical protein RMH85_10825 [Polyangiaceae bacterium LLY-WYZ-15_(1-7)]|nr:hypothetical protein [Sandaracinus sp.]HJK92881.1 hypothetical protein [Polyangiaceae bacterium LLY-WYZ-15_(1-7)]HJL00662.1 hypothetical protein [Polyangiaceae bacterium LLY-WYZ-15_(1-7)]HJL08986.1 hypothetical protein [Polyangiaceae bacterium LLY-WYZ-15_(1-7)]HJL30385.1 hypothetical protein [Polyangiaceae bacterium LLY-WYZ-15_(1-7)]